MKKTIFLFTAVVSTVFFLSGCNNNESINKKTINDKVQPEVNQSTETVSASNESDIMWKSEPQGDFVEDTRDPSVVCKEIQVREGLNNCKIIVSKQSQDEKECADGMSVAGCFACKFECS